MKIGIDVDGVITDIPEVIMCIANSSKHEIHIITFRNDRYEVAKLLESHNIHYDYIHYAPEGSHMIDWKKKMVENLGIEVMIEDTPEILAALPRHVKRIWIADPDVYNLSAAIEGMHKSM